MSKFNVGDMVRVRDWEDMAEEYGVSKDAMDIPCDGVFVYSMKDFCGGVYTITAVFEATGVHDAYYLEGCDSGKIKWEFSDDMLRLVKRAEVTNEPKPIQANILFAFSDAGVEVEEEYAITTVDTCEYDYNDEEKKGMIQALADYLEVEISFLTQKRSTDDEMDDLPLEIVNEEENEPYNGKVICTRDHDGLTVGKIYTIIDGVFIDDNRNKRPMDNSLVYKDSDWFTVGFFIPLVEK